MLLLGITGSAAAQLLFGVSNSLWLLYAARALGGALSAATIPAASAYVADLTTAGACARGMAWLRTAIGFGSIAGLALGEFAARKNSPQMALWPFSDRWLFDPLFPGNGADAPRTWDRDSMVQGFAAFSADTKKRGLDSRLAIIWSYSIRPWPCRRRTIRARYLRRHFCDIRAETVCIWTRPGRNRLYSVRARNVRFSVHRGSISVQSDVASVPDLRRSIVDGGEPSGASHHEDNIIDIALCRCTRFRHGPCVTEPHSVDIALSRKSTR